MLTHPNSIRNFGPGNSLTVFLSLSFSGFTFYRPLTAGLIGTSPRVKREPEEEVRIELSFSSHHLNQSIEPDPRSISSSSKKRLADSSLPGVKPERHGGNLEGEGAEHEEPSHHLPARTRTASDVNSKSIKRLTNLNPNKRVCTQLQNPDRDDHIDRGVSSHLSNHIVTPSISHVTRSGNQDVPLNNPEEFKDWLTLDEIDKMKTGGPSRRFNLMAIIDHKKSERCEKASSGTCDYRMTVYLSDHSRPKGAKRVTCNLFWRTEEECPSWLKANWKIIFLFNVHKRSSTIYHTQIIGPSRSYHWAIWCPAYLGCREQLETSTQRGSRSNDPTLTIGDLQLTPHSLKRFAQHFYDSHLAYEDRYSPHLRSDLDRSHPSDSLPIPTITSVFKRISDLTSPSPIKVDLCVKIVDIWRDAPGNDRLTVTDFTSNEHLRFPSPMGLDLEPGESMMEEQNVTPSLRFHLDHGGDRTNWRSTASRLISIYVAQPILGVVLRKLDRIEEIEARGRRPAGRDGEVGSNGRRRAQGLNGHDFRAKLIDRFVRLNGIEIRFKPITSTAGSSTPGTVYGLMENPTTDPMTHYQGVGRLDLEEDDSHSEEQDLDRLDDLTLESCSSRISPIDPTDPILKSLDQARQDFQLELDAGSFS